MPSRTFFIAAPLYFFAFILGSAEAQRQLVLTAGDHVVSRFSEGDKIRYKLKNLKEEKKGFIVEIHEFYIITNFDTVQLRQVGRMAPEKREPSLINKIGKVMVIAGAGYFILDQVNSMLVLNEGPNIPEQVWKPAAILVGAGLPLCMFRKNFMKVGGKSKLLTITHDSPLFKYDK